MGNWQMLKMENNEKNGKPKIEIQILQQKKRTIKTQNLDKKKDKNSVKLD